MLKSQIALNLAIINYCEIQDHNDRIIENGGELSEFFQSKAAEEGIRKSR